MAPAERKKKSTQGQKTRCKKVCAGAERMKNTQKTSALTLGRGLDDAVFEVARLGLGTPSPRVSTRQLRAESVALYGSKKKARRREKKNPSISILTYSSVRCVLFCPILFYLYLQRGLRDHLLLSSPVL